MAEQTETKVDLQKIADAFTENGWRAFFAPRGLMVERRNERGYLVEASIFPDGKAFWKGEIDWSAMDIIRANIAGATT